MKTTLTEENYLKALFHLVDNEGKVTINELSKFLNVKMPSVNNMMKKFAEKNGSFMKPINLWSLPEAEGVKLLLWFANTDLPKCFW